MVHAVLILGFVVAVLLPDRLLAQPRKPSTIAEIATYNGADRGLPIGWVPMDIVPTNVGGAAIAV
ncbi:MAG TPA: hypothetical protein VFQ89_01405, partial [Candidatus Binatia bacterium]|nr:hypothetical protein [Candidatus Binatia bacterium]